MLLGAGTGTALSTTANAQKYKVVSEWNRLAKLQLKALNWVGRQQASIPCNTNEHILKISSSHHRPGAPMTEFNTGHLHADKSYVLVFHNHHITVGAP